LTHAQTTAYHGGVSATAVVNRFDGLTKKGDGWLARCPAHGDKVRSLSIDVRDGKVLLKCFAGCTADDIAAAVGLKTSDLFLDKSDKSASPAQITVESLAASKGLPVEVLRRYGVKSVAEMPAADKLKHGIGGSLGVWIPYFNADGTITGRTRLRTTHIAKDGSRWLGSFGSPTAYGQHDLADAQAQGILCVCEGESDYWTLRTLGVPALGIPGASMVKCLQRSHLAGVQTLYVLQDSDAAGAGFVAAVQQHVAAWGVSAVHAVPIPGAKDINDLYRADPANAESKFMDLLRAAAAGPVAPSREFSTAGDIYTLTVPEYGIRIELDQIRRAWGELRGEIWVDSEAEGTLTRGTVSLSDIEKRQKFADSMKKRSSLPVDWVNVWEDFALRCLEAEKTGSPGVWLDEVTPRAPDMCVEVSGFELPLDLPACLFGDGDTGKSFIALQLLTDLTRRGVTCALVDAEMEAGVHAARLIDLAGGQRPRIAHLRLDKPLALSVDHVRRFVRDRNVRYVVYDSVGFLTPEPEKSESALSYMRAVRQVGTGSLSIAHVTKGQEIKPEQQKPFGSNFYYQSFRRIWYAQAEAEPDADGRKVIGIWDRKANTARKRPPFGIALTVRDGFANVGPCDLGQSCELTEKLPLWRQLQSILRSGPASVEALAEQTEKGTGTIRATLNRHKQVFAMAIVGGENMWTIQG
jgi:hypothetical protein